MAKKTQKISKDDLPNVDRWTSSGYGLTVGKQSTAQKKATQKLAEQIAERKKSEKK